MLTQLAVAVNELSPMLFFLCFLVVKLDAAAVHGDFGWDRNVIHLDNADYKVYTFSLRIGVVKDLLYSTWNSTQCYVAAWRGRGFKGEWIHVYIWLSPFTVHLRLSHIVC